MAFSTCDVSLPRGPLNAGHEELQDQRLAPLHWLCGTGVFGARFNFVPMFNTEPRRGFGGIFLWENQGPVSDTDFLDLQEFSSFCEVSFDLNVGRYISNKIPTRI